MLSREGFLTLSMALCRAAITLTQSCTHSNAWLCSGGSCCPTTTPPQPPVAKHEALLFHHLPHRTYCHLYIPMILHVIRHMQNYRKLHPAIETRNMKGTRQDNETRMETKTRPKNLHYPTFHRSLLHSYSVLFAVGPHYPLSRYKEMVLMILCPPSPDSNSGFTRQCS